MMERVPWTTMALYLALAAPVSAQSLADIARQERERQKSIPPTSTTFTNDIADELFPVPDEPELPPKPGEAPATEEKGEKGEKAATPAKPSGPVDNQGHDEKWWRTAFGEARTELTRAENQVKLLQLKLNEANRDLLTRSDVFNRELVIGAVIAGLTAEMETAQKATDAAKEKVAQLEDQLRQSGGLPGWAR